MSTISVLEQRSPQLVPDAAETRVAIKLAVKDIARATDAHRPDDFLRLHHAQKIAEAVVAYVIMTGGTLSEARGWAIQAALIRDAQQTIAERAASRVAA